MMKQVAFAAVAAMAAAYKPQLMVSYLDTDNYFLGLELQNPATLKMPRDFRAKDGACDGWILDQNDEGYDSFELLTVSPPDGIEGCDKLRFVARPAPFYEKEIVSFTNTCAEQDEDNKLIVYVQVLDNADGF